MELMAAAEVTKKSEKGRERKMCFIRKKISLPPLKLPSSLLSFLSLSSLSLSLSLPPSLPLPLFPLSLKCGGRERFFDSGKREGGREREGRGKGGKGRERGGVGGGGGGGERERERERERKREREERLKEKRGAEKASLLTINE